MIQPATIREIHRLCREWDNRPRAAAVHSKPMGWIPTWLALLVASAGLLAIHLGPKIPLTGWSYVILLWGIIGLEVFALGYLVVSGAFDAVDIWKELKSSSEAFPPDEDRDLEKQMEFLGKLAAFSDSELLFVARSLETKSRRMENRRMAITGFATLLAAVLAFSIAHSSMIEPIVPGYAWIPKAWPILRVGLLLIAVATAVGFPLGLGALWLESSASANRALTLRRVVEDRNALKETV